MRKTKKKTAERGAKPAAAATTPKDASDESLQPVADWANGRYGAKKQLADAMTAAGAPATRWNIERWLNPDRAKRDHPLHGNALILLRVWKALRTKGGK
jgi:hypothetical protein